MSLPGGWSARRSTAAALTLFFLAATADPAPAATICGSAAPLHRRRTGRAWPSRGDGPRLCRSFRDIAVYLPRIGGGRCRCYLRKRAAEGLGWRPGGICGRWRRARPSAATASATARDGCRGAGTAVMSRPISTTPAAIAARHRLIFVRGMGAGEEWLIFVSTDHEASFAAFAPARVRARLSARVKTGLRFSMKARRPSTSRCCRSSA